MNNATNIREILCNIEELPVLPGIALKILEKIKDPETPLYQLAELLSSDPPLSVKVLSVVNSPFFGLKNKITNLPHAVNLLGEESLKYIALSFSLIAFFKDNKSKFDYASFWRQSLTCAVTSRLIARALNQSDSEDMYFLGLVHNIGILAMVQSRPDQYAMVIKKVESEKVYYHVAENEIFGCNHMEVGAFLIDTWGLPEIFSRPILNHHCPEQISQADENAKIRAKIIHLACEIYQFLHAEDKALNLAMVSQLLDEYGMAAEVSLETIVEKACVQTEPLMHLFNIKNKKEIDYVSILDESKKEMYKLSLEMVKKIREQQHTIDNLSLLASQDGLTKLKNYKSFKEALNRELAISKRYGFTSILALADLDNFKAINDLFGHITGDHILKNVSRFFTDNIRESDVVARYGGEEFAFIFSRTSIEEGFKTMDRLRVDLSLMEFEYLSEKISVTMSVGITSFSENDNYTATDLLRQADSAMYHAKKKGRNRTFVFKPGDFS